jgi:hypothetical protein
MATVTDATGKTGTASRAVTTRNAVSAPPSSPPPSQSPPPAPGGLKAIITSPGAGATVGRDVTVNVWVEGASGSSTSFTLAVDGKTLGAQTVSGAHAWFVWPTTSLANGPHTLTATVKDASGKTGSVNQTVTVRN